MSGGNENGLKLEPLGLWTIKCTQITKNCSSFQVAVPSSN